MGKQAVNPLWTAYNNAMNEGGEGYNPHEKYVSVGAGEPLWSKLGSRAAKLQRLMNSTSDAEPRFAELAAELALVQAAQSDAMARNI